MNIKIKMTRKQTINNDIKIKIQIKHEDGDKNKNENKDEMKRG